MKELTVVENDRIGLLADLTELLGMNGVNIESISVDATSGGKAIIRVILAGGSWQKAKALLKEKAFNVLDTSVLVVRLPDRPGELAKVSRLLADNGIAVQNVYVIDRKKGEAVDAIQTNDNEKAKKLLKAYL